MTVGSGRLLEAVDSIYHAVGAPDAWPAALEQVAAATGAQAALLVIRAGPGCASVVEAAFGVGADQAAAVAEELLAAAAAEGPVALELRGPGTTANRAALSVATGLVWAVGVNVGHGENPAALWLFRPAGPGFEAADLARLERCAGHVRHALELSLRLEGAECRADEASEAFDRVAIGTVLVDAECRPLWSNRAALRISEQDDGFRITPEGLRGATARDTRRLHAAVAEASNGATQPAIGLRMRRRSSARPYELVIVPGRRQRGWLRGRRTHAVVFVSAGGAALTGFARLAFDLYRLSAAESRVALLLLAGHDLRETARTLGISRNTVRAHLGSIFRKTDTSCQAELIRILARGPAAIRPPGSSDRHPAVALADDEP